MALTARSLEAVEAILSVASLAAIVIVAVGIATKAWRLAAQAARIEVLLAACLLMINALQQDWLLFAINLATLASAGLVLAAAETTP